MDEVTLATRAAYDRRAAAYRDRWGQVDVMQAELVAFANLIPRTSAVLDLGCGPGRDAAALGRLGHRAVAFDLSLGMLNQADRRLSRVCGDALTLPFSGAVFAGVWACASLLHLQKPDMPTALREVRRVLARQGHLYLSVRCGDTEEWVEDDHGGRYFANYLPIELDRHLEANGFAVVSSSQRPDAAGRDIVWLARVARAP